VRSPDRLPSALAHLDEVWADLGDRFVVFLDFDGTLAPIVDDPAQARMPASTRRAVAELAERVPVAIASGRALEDVRRRVDLEDLVYAGDHGFEVHGVAEPEKLPRPEGLAAELAQARRALEARVADLADVHVEAKPYSLAVHHRQASPEAGDRAREAVADVVGASSLLSWRQGSQVLEVLPAVDWDKGRCVQALARALPGEPRGVVYVGDDATDEDAFAVLGEDDVGVLVAREERSTRADYRLADTDEVRAFLVELTRRSPPSGDEP